MVPNFSPNQCKIGFVNMVLFTIVVVLRHRNKMASLNASIAIFSMLPELFDSNRTYLCLFGVNVSSQRLTLSTSCLLRFSNSNHLIRSFSELSQITHLFDGRLCFAKNMNIQHKFDEHARPGIFVGYPYAQKAIGFMIFKLTRSTSLVM